MDTTKELCQCCKLPVHRSEKPLCNYCYIRSELGTAKYIMFKAMMDNGNKSFTINEILEMTNELRKSINVKPVKYDAVYRILRNYSKSRNSKKRSGRKSRLIVRKKKVKWSIKPLNQYRLSPGLQKRLKMYESRWYLGHTINKKEKNKTFRMTYDYKERATSIRIQHQKGELGLYDYMMVKQKMEINEK